MSRKPFSSEMGYLLTKGDKQRPEPPAKPPAKPAKKIDINVSLKKGEQVPQAVEALQEIMARDAELMMEQAKIISHHSVTINKLRQQLARLKRQFRHDVYGGKLGVNYRKEARGRECQIRVDGVCEGNSDTTVLCHLPGAGIARKQNDIHGAWGDDACHAAVDGRIKTGHSRQTLKLWHLEGVIRTQKILISEGKL